MNNLNHFKFENLSEMPPIRSIPARTRNSKSRVCQNLQRKDIVS